MQLDDEEVDALRPAVLDLARQLVEVAGGDAVVQRHPVHDLRTTFRRPACVQPERVRDGADAKASTLEDRRSIRVGVPRGQPAVRDPRLFQRSDRRVDPCLAEVEAVVASGGEEAEALAARVRGRRERRSIVVEHRGRVEPHDGRPGDRRANNTLQVGHREVDVEDQIGDLAVEGVLRAGEVRVVHQNRRRPRASARHRRETPPGARRGPPCAPRSTPRCPTRGGPVSSVARPCRASRPCRGSPSRRCHRGSASDTARCPSPRRRSRRPRTAMRTCGTAR